MNMETERQNEIQYSIVIPCYNSSQTIGIVVELLEEKFLNVSIQVILVDDCSPDEDQTANEIRRIVRMHSNVLGIWLTQNSGQHNAILCGLRHARGKYIICMDDDLQTHPNEIDKLITQLNKGYDIVYAYYPQKKESSFRLLGSKFNSWTVRKLIGKPKDLNTSSFWIARDYIKDSIITYKYPYTYMAGLVLRTTKNIGNVEVVHHERTVGKSGYNLRRLIKLWSNIIGFSIKPLRVATFVGTFFAIVGLLSAAAIVVRKLIFNINTVGWTSLIVAISFFSGLILMFMGMIGEYIGRMFIADSDYPQYVIKDIEGFS